MRRNPALLLILLATALLAGAARDARAASPQRIRVSASDVVSTISHPFWGVNYVGFWDPIQGSAASRNAMRNAGFQVLRFPGGEPANWHDWYRPAAPPYWTTTSTDTLWAYAQGVGATLMLQTNPTANEVSDTKVLNDPSGAHAAGWVTYARSKGIRAPYWEVGNEQDIGLTNDFDRAAMRWYYTRFNEHAAAMKRADPSIKVFGPVGTNAWQWWGLHSLDMFMESAGNRRGSGLADGVSLHYYPAQGCVGWDNVVSVAQDWPRFMDQINSVIAAYDTRPLPVFISETNAAVGALGCEINQTMAAALANADLLGAYRASGVQAVQFYGAIHGAVGWGLLYMDNEARPAETPTPTYFIFPIWTKSGSTVLRVTGASDPARTMSAYASRRADGGIQVVAINKTSAAVPLEVSFAGYEPRGRTVAVYELRPASGGIWDKDVVYNGVRMPRVTGPSLPGPLREVVSGAAYSRSLPAYSMTLLEFPPAPQASLSPRVHLPAVVR